MQYVKFNLDKFRYVLAIVDVVEIIPYVKLKAPQNLAKYMAGQCTYRGILVPVIDLCSLFLKRPCKKKLRTRIILVEVTNNNSMGKMIGLMVEKATEIVKVEEDSFMDAGVYEQDSPYIGPVLADSSGLICRILTNDIFSRIDDEILSPFTTKTA